MSSPAAALQLLAARSLPPRAIIGWGESAGDLSCGCSSGGYMLAGLLLSFDELYDQFLSVRDLGEGRRRRYEVLRRMIHRYESYIRCSTGRKRYAFDLLKVIRDCRLMFSI